MRPLLAILLVVSILLPSVVYHTGVSWRRIQLRKEAKQAILQNLPASSLFRLGIPVDGHTPNSFEWVKEGEFRFQGMMYDVVTRQEVADSTILVAWADHHEAAFESSLDHLMARLLGSDPVHGTMQDSFARFLKQLYPPAMPFSSQDVVVLKHCQPADQSSGAGHQFILHPPSPPPRLFG